MLEADDRGTLDSVALDSISSRPQEAQDSAETAAQRSKPKSKSWYPGKYLPINVAFRALSEKMSDGDRTAQPTPTLEEVALAARIEEEQRLTCSGDVAEEERKEAMICSTVRAVRQKFLERRIVGSIFISRMSGVISTAITSEITQEDISNHLLARAEKNPDMSTEDPLNRAELTGQYKRALSMTDSILNSMERRSLTWDTVEFNHDTKLTRGTTIGISDPIVGMINFSITLQLSATTQSLLASRKRFEAAREISLSRVLNESESEPSTDEIKGLG